MKLTVPLACVVLGAATTAIAQTGSAVPTLHLDLPVLEAPYNLAHGGRAPSMAQSLAVTTDFYEATHHAIQRAWGIHTFLAGTTLFFFDGFTSLLPPGDAWVHEEFHRAVLGNRGIGSFDDVYKFNLSGDAIAVSHVKDEDLVRLKADHPADQVRLGAAGIEGEYLAAAVLEKNRFFYGSAANNVPLYWIIKLGAQGYVASGATSWANSFTDEMNAKDGTNVPKRDFTGHDFTGWVYDLFRPNEPYAARGVHPSGVGVDRYIKDSDLTPQEHAFLKREGQLQLLNFLDPNLFGIDGFAMPGGLRMSVTASHLLTSFGHTVDLNVFMKRRDANLLVALHRYTNGVRSLPGVDVQLLEYRVGKLSLSPRLAAWMQPEDQLLRSSTFRPGGLMGFRVRPISAGRFGTYVELEGKTEGWVAGNVYLNRNVSARIGGSMTLY